ncbi:MULTISPECIES: NYN domain-containing protein [Thalassolituus]|uniref:LabA-like NYN domain-containing protein n=1 Tax=Thalassolituus TaxID=187492 RepID=UPI000C452237|nr:MULTISPECIES: NYN domain-containing protein [Thalassolituus]MAX85475.1 nuclease [Oceanospirillaceae bacterium]|tara:strand:+ start:2521 stop:3003 length:483 start_codon:yes stop_codon:yes gene_type:complete
MTSRISLFADVQNIYYTCRQEFGRHFNYRALWDELIKGRELHTAVAYAIDRGDAGQMNFQRILKDIGFHVRLKPYIQRRDGSAKGDWDVGITIDLLDAAPSSDIIVLLSGDGDFDLALKRARRDGAQCWVVGVEALTAKSLIDAADRFIPITEAHLLPSG